MKEYFNKQFERIDALNLRERMMVFAATLAAMVFLAWQFVLGPAMARQSKVSQDIVRLQNNMAGIENDIAARIAAQAIDPDHETREKLKKVEAEIVAKGEGLRTMQKGLVAPNRIAPLLQSMMAAGGKLRLVSLNTLPVTGLGDPLPLGGKILAAPAGAGENEVNRIYSSTMAAAHSGTQSAPPPILPINLPGLDQVAAKAAAAAPAAPTEAAAAATAKPVPRAVDLIYRHGVEMTVEGNYLDMVAYMTMLEAMPTQLFWGQASLDARDYPKARLRLVLFTLSLDQRWMKL
jgi:MSHA biogenesis protein MshJ